MKIVHTLILNRGRGKNYPRKKCDVSPNTRVLHCWTRSDPGFSELRLGRVIVGGLTSYHSGCLKEIKFLLQKQSPSPSRPLCVSLASYLLTETGAGRMAVKQDGLSSLVSSVLRSSLALLLCSEGNDESI